MFTTGSKLFIGASTLAIAGTLIYGVANGGALGTLGLVSAAIAFVFLAGINFWVRDSNVSSMDTAGIETCAASHRSPSRSMWPLVAGLGAALVPVGLVVGSAITWMAAIVLMVTTVEWMVQSWSERASGDPAYNSSIRRRILHPMELPVLAAIGVGVIIFSFSRIMLYTPSTGGMVVFGGIAAAVLLFGALIAAKRNVAKSVVTALCGVAALGLVGAGVATALAGGHHIEKHELNEVSSEHDTCQAELTEADENSTRAIAAKSNLAATIILEDGKLRAEVIGINGNPEVVTLLRSNDNFVKFKNLDEGEYRLRAYLGNEIIDPGAANERSEEDAVCSQAVSEGGTQFIIVKPPRPSFAAAAETPYQFTVPGVETAVLPIEVP